MHTFTDLPPWDRLLKRILWQQLGALQGQTILDFGSGEGITADHFAAENTVWALEPDKEMLRTAWRDHPYTQLTGDITALSDLPDAMFDVILCHNVLEYIDDKAGVLRQLARLLKKDGTMSVVKHNRPGRVLQMAVLLDDPDKAEALLDGSNGSASRFGTIRYYEDDDLRRWAPELEVCETFGIRTFWDLQQDQHLHGEEAWQERMARLQQRVSQTEPYRSVAFFHHLLLRKSP